MKERPILFNADMVNAILNGSKTQTRRVIKNPDYICDGVSVSSLIDQPHVIANYSPYGKVGDQLWVRETFRLYSKTDECACYEHCGCPPTGTPIYRTDDDNSETKWKPSIFMNRKYSRIQLEITDIRVERLNDISEDDADSECFAGDFPHRVLPSLAKHFDGSMSLQECFKVLWESINGKGSWRENPWVWVVEFKAVGIGESN